jgi:hypothetical protein
MSFTALKSNGFKKNFFFFFFSTLACGLSMATLPTITGDAVCSIGSDCTSISCCLDDTGGYGISNVTFNNFSLYHGSQFYWLRKSEYSEKSTNLLHVTDKLYLIIKRLKYILQYINLMCLRDFDWIKNLCYFP